MELKIEPANSLHHASTKLGEAVRPTAAQKAEAIREIKDTGRNSLCPCGCGKKAKKCENGKRVLAFKRLLRGSAKVEVMVLLAILFVLAFMIFDQIRTTKICRKSGLAPVATTAGYKCADSTAQKTVR